MIVCQLLLLRPPQNRRLAHRFDFRHIEKGASAISTKETPAVIEVEIEVATVQRVEIGRCLYISMAPLSMTPGPGIRRGHISLLTSRALICHKDHGHRTPICRRLRSTRVPTTSRMLNFKHVRQLVVSVVTHDVLVGKNVWQQIKPVTTVIKLVICDQFAHFQSDRVCRLIWIVT